MKLVTVEDGLFHVSRSGEVYRDYGRGELTLCAKTNIGGRKSTGNRGYSCVTATVNGKQQSFYVHRLLAAAFVPNKHNHNIVAFLDSDTTNIAVSNLKWVTHSESLTIANANGKRDYYKHATECSCGELTNAEDGICTACKDVDLKLRRKKYSADRIAETVEGIDLDLLKPHIRRAVVLRGDGLTLQQIADKEKVTREAIRLRLVRAHEVNRKNATTY